MNSGIGGMFKALYFRELDDPGGKSAPLKYTPNLRAGVHLTLAALLLLELGFIHFFNKFIALREGVFLEGSKLEAEYQRRASLIPSLAGISRDYSRHERELMTYISDARALKEYSRKLGGAAAPGTSARIEQVVSRISALAEQYPDLKADRSSKALMTKTALTEDRVASARGDYIQMIDSYNRAVMLFPGCLFARPMKFRAFNVYMPGKDPRPENNKRLFYIF